MSLICLPVGEKPYFGEMVAKFVSDHAPKFFPLEFKVSRVPSRSLKKVSKWYNGKDLVDVFSQDTECMMHRASSKAIC